jgi:hypothetical protein
MLIERVVNMKTSNEESVLFLVDDTPICVYCGKQLKVENKKEWESKNHYSWEEEWTEYECDCEDWNKAIEIDNKLKELNWKIYHDFCKYQSEYGDLISSRKYKLHNKRYNDLK